MKLIRAFVPLLLVLCLALQARGQVDISNISNLSVGSANKTLNQNTHTNTNSADIATQQSDTSSSGQTPKGIEYHVEIPDSELLASVYFFHRPLREVKIMTLNNPTLTPTGTQFCDQLDALNGNYFLTVSEIGHPHYSLFPSFNKLPGLAYKANILSGFYKTPENISFYQVQKPYTVLSYHSSDNKDYQLHLTHTQNINSRWNYALDYHLFSPTGAFINSSATNHLIDLTTNYYSYDARYQISTGIIWQKFLLGENGGISNPDAFINKNFYYMSSIPVNDTRRMSLTNDFTFFVRQSFNTVRQFEWYRPIKKDIVDTVITYDTLHLSRFDTVTMDSIPFDSITTSTHYHLHDTIIGFDTIQPHKPHSYNTGVLAFDIQYDRQKYQYVDSTLYHRLTALLYWTNDAFPDHRWHNPLKLSGGIRPQVSFLKQNPTVYANETISKIAIFPFARIILSPLKAFSLDVLAESTPNLSDYNLDAQLQFPFRDSLGNAIRCLTVHAVAKAYAPELIYTAQQQRHDYLANNPIHAVGIRKLEVDYHHDNLLDIYLAAQHIDHNIWFEKLTLSDSTTILAPSQAKDNAVLLQSRVNMYLTITNWLHFDMQQMVQYSSNQDAVRVPLFASKNSLYTDFYLFHRALRVQVGVDLRYHTLYKADGYDPAFGTFYRQNEVEVGNYIWADFFINLQVKRASIYAKASHFNSFFEQQAYCIIPEYPSKQFGLYFGLTWKLFD